MLQKRLAAAIDENISKTQLGFRKAKSTAIPIACIRRLLDEAEATRNPLCITFLDWEKHSTELNRTN